PCVHPSLPLGPPTLSLSIHDSHRHLHSFPTRRSSDLSGADLEGATGAATILDNDSRTAPPAVQLRSPAAGGIFLEGNPIVIEAEDRKSTRLNSSHVKISYAVFCLKKKKVLP